MFTSGNQHRLIGCKPRHLLDLWIGITVMQSSTWLSSGVTDDVLIYTPGWDSQKGHTQCCLSVNKGLFPPFCLLGNRHTDV